jgi:hypothetical protein
MSASVVSSIFFLLLVAAGTYVVWKQNFSVRSTIFISAFLLGAALRMRYHHITPLPVRAYDYTGHIQYISYVLEHWAIPLSRNGWEFHQPPLYYFCMASILAVLQFLFGVMSVASASGVVSLLLSWFCLGMGLWTIHKVFPKLSEEYLLLAAYFFSTIPGLIFFATRVSNDALFHALSFVWFYFFLKEWSTPNRSRLVGLAVLTALLSLTKFTGLLYLALLFLLAFLRPRSFEPRWRSGLIIIALFAVLFAWHPIQRSQESHLTRITTLGNAYMPKVDYMGQASFKELVTFSPLRVVGLPFNNIHEDAFGRRNFWEFAYRSMFFGQFSFYRFFFLGVFMVLVSLFLLPYFGYGSYLALRKDREHLPSLLVVLVLFVGLLAYRLNFPNPTNQDVRYIVLVFLPITVLVTHGIRRAPQKLAVIGVGVASLFVLSAFSFNVLL